MRTSWLVPFLLATCLRAGDSAGEWPVYGGDAGGKRFSPLHQITRENVSALQIAWVYHTGDAYQPQHGRSTAFEATPLYLDGTLYLSTPLGRAVALDPLTGKEKWSYRAKLDRDAGFGDFASRGVATWKPREGGRRIYLATIDARLIALDASTGTPCDDFGDNGEINLRQGLRIAPRSFEDYEETSPPVVVGDTVIIGSGVADNGSVSQASGEVRAFDARTGHLKWTWDPIPQKASDTGAETWEKGSTAITGAANAWSVIVADPAKGLVFIPTGSASPDYYGGRRRGSNLFANSMVAIRAQTGEVVWHFQTVHHDLWDYDVASPGMLFEVHREGKSIPAIAVGSKTGNLFILNRETGKPIFGVNEKPVPQTDVDGEETSATQPFPVLPKPLAPQTAVTARDAWGPTEESRAWCRDELSKLRSEGIFTPPSVRGSLFIPGNIGGMAWGGAAYDETNRLIVVPANNLPAEVRLIPRDKFDEENDRGRSLGGDWEFAPQRGTPYGMARRLLVTPNKLPCTAPPWGTLTAIDGDTGQTRWQVPLGQMPGTEKLEGSDKWGTISLGGPLITAGGLVFMGGTIDLALRAFDVSTGRELWKAKLPSSARSSPMTFQGSDGKQYVVIAAGGHGLPMTPLADTLIAFRLP